MFRIKFVDNAVLALLNYLLSIVGNYGLAIIITTVIVKLALLPLSIKQEKSMIRMKELQPKVDEINQKYKNNKAKIQEMTAELYKKEKVNPLSGCLPLLIQLPIFVALYYAFIGDAIPENASFLWFNLKSPDALFIFNNFSFNFLPIISAILMIVQQKLMTPSSQNGNEMEKSMQTMMYFMPIMILVLFYRMPSGVNLYYTVNTLLSIILQLYIIKKVRKNG